jgi:hypothetical protein
VNKHELEAEVEYYKRREERIVAKLVEVSGIPMPDGGDYLNDILERIEMLPQRISYRAPEGRNK